MGMDITMRLVNNLTGEVICKDLYDGRSREWFNNLMNAEEDEYRYLPAEYGLPDCAMEIDKARRDEGGWYFGYSYISLAKYREWVEKYRPELHAGWVSRYDSWLYHKKNIEPIEVYHYLPSDVNAEDYVFIEYTNEYDPNTVVLKKVNSLLYPTADLNEENYTIYFFFDN